MNGRVAFRLDDDEFVKRITSWMTTLGKARFVTFLNGFVAKRIIDNEFMDRLIDLIKIVELDTLVKKRCREVESPSDYTYSKMSSSNLLTTMQIGQRECQKNSVKMFQ